MGEAKDIPPVETAEPGALSGGLRVWVARLTGPTAVKGTLAVGAQGVSSAVNFGVGIALARFASQEEFGAYVLVFAILLFGRGIQTALLTGPMAVLGAAREENGFRRYVTSLALVQIGVSACLALLAFGGVALLVALAASGELVGAALGMATAVAFVQGKEFFRRVLFARLEAGKVLLNELAYAAIMAGGIVTLVQRERAGAGGEWLTARNVFGVMAVSAAAAAALGFWQTRTRFTRGPLGMREHCRENWRFGRWALGAQLGGSLTTMGTKFIVAAFGGLAGAATLEAPRLLLAPLQVLSMGGGSILTPRASQKYAEGGKRALVAFMLPVALILGVVFIGYAAMIALASEFWLRLLYGDRYAGAGTILVLWAAVFALWGLYLVPAQCLNAVRRPHIYMYAVLGIGVAHVVLAAILTSSYGPLGAVVARVIGGLLLLVSLGASCCWVLIGIKDDRAKDDHG